MDNNKDSKITFCDDKRSGTGNKDGTQGWCFLFITNKEWHFEDEKSMEIQFVPTKMKIAPDEGVRRITTIDKKSHAINNSHSSRKEGKIYEK